MNRGYRNMRTAIYSCPHALKEMEIKLQKIASSYLRYSTGIEIEASQLDKNNRNKLEKELKKLNLISFQLSGCEEESRFRIPAGIQGMITLYHLSEILKRYYGLNLQSGIHYHIDLNSFIQEKSRQFIIQNFLESEKEILKELDQWNYNGSYNSPKVKCFSKNSWVNVLGRHNTAEFRIGEMTFDYEILIKRIIHAQSIVTKTLTKKRKEIKMLT